MHSDTVLKFPFSERAFHLINLVTWFILAISGCLIYFKYISESQVKFFMNMHIVVAIIFSINFLAFIFLNTDRFILLMRNLLIWDRDTFAWFKNLGGYPKKIFGINFGPDEVAPQGRFNAGQKLTYLFFIFMIFGLIITGWALYALAPLIGKAATNFMFYFHIWGGIIATLIVILAHVPMVFLNKADFKAMFSNGEIPLEDAMHHSPKWVKNDLTKVVD
ncbi:cytochrome b/b6 domain-containing protein [Campylobacter fetus]|uniref:cytochrome b/b6 domain-containing protein n=1 Tax=Campylobacter fetus TaxID=196 RepID=UPI0008189F40|nr:cytochrome b/b6 domain-containing protein [Campylobacter fetus]OCR92070.1 formate dehydrogenase [Campylobacter fetus subsp. testudinum]